MRPFLPAFAATLALALVLAAPLAAPAQQRESSASPAGEHPAVGYLAPGLVDYRVLLPGPPEVGSVEDRIDVAAIMALQSDVSPERWKTANDDDAFVYPRFDEAFGGPIDRAHAPRLVHLLNRVMHDVSTPTFAAKKVFARLRPYQRYQLTRVCGETAAPAPVAEPEDRSSYPSGHEAYGWALALVLAQVAPDRAQQVLARAYDYGLSREICGVHFPSDVEAGRVMATAVVTRLMANGAFRSDLAAAKREYARAHR
jgi:acid phosphatase (class A)